MANHLLLIDNANDISGLKDILKKMMKEIHIVANNQDTFEHNQFTILNLIRKSNPDLPPIDYISYDKLVEGGKGE